MTQSILTKQQIEALQSSRLDRSTPFLIRNVRQTQFSIARFSGGCSYMGKHYVYVQPTDELVRQDVLKWINEQKKEKAEAKEPQGKQLNLF